MRGHREHPTADTPTATASTDDAPASAAAAVAASVAAAAPINAPAAPIAAAAYVAATADTEQKSCSRNLKPYLDGNVFPVQINGRRTYNPSIYLDGEHIPVRGWY